MWVTIKFQTLRNIRVLLKYFVKFVVDLCRPVVYLEILLQIVHLCLVGYVVYGLKLDGDPHFRFTFNGGRGLRVCISATL